MFQKLTRPLDLFDHLIHLRDDGSATASPRRATAAAGLWTVAAHHAGSDAALHSDVWERHPTGDEVLCALSGAFAVHLRDHGEGSAPFATLTSGQALVVPAGHWHRLTVVEPGDLLAITPRAGTRHERVTPDAPGAEREPHGRTRQHRDGGVAEGTGTEPW